MGMGFPPRPRRPKRHRPRNRPNPRRRNRMFTPRESRSRSRPPRPTYNPNNADEQRRARARSVPVPRAERARRDFGEQQERGWVVDRLHARHVREPRREPAVRRAHDRSRDRAARAGYRSRDWRPVHELEGHICDRVPGRQASVRLAGRA